MVATLCYFHVLIGFALSEFQSDCVDFPVVSMLLSLSFLNILIILDKLFLARIQIISQTFTFIVNPFILFRTNRRATFAACLSSFIR